ncbi:MAG: cytochrome c3 family protein [Acidobacteriota bacterium]|nr:cytochrome c3 family protein [Acidobacteriota bacterium]
MPARHGFQPLFFACLVMLSSPAVVPAEVPVRDEVCLECHLPARHGLSMHPLGVRPTRSGKLPLVDGLVGCSTCHERHGSTLETSVADDFHLRLQPPLLCASCHRGADGRWDRPHALYADTIHGGSRLAGGDGGLARFDALSLRCLSCHDGNSAPAAAFTEGPSMGETGRSHPIGVAFRRSATAAVIDDQGPARWFGGRVGCTSCHRLYGSPSPHLPASSGLDRLCQGCHRY